MEDNLWYHIIQAATVTCAVAAPGLHAARHHVGVQHPQHLLISMKHASPRPHSQPPEPEACLPAHWCRGIGGVLRAVTGGLELGVIVGGVSGRRDAAVLRLGTGGDGGDAARGLGGDVGDGGGG
jgi:hypothetical protein